MCRHVFSITLLFLSLSLSHRDAFPRVRTSGATNSGLRALTSSSGMTVSVMREPAIGAIVLHRTLFFLPSRQIVLLKPQMASLADASTPHPGVQSVTDTHKEREREVYKNRQTRQRQTHVVAEEDAYGHTVHRSPRLSLSLTQTLCRAPLSLTNTSSLSLPHTDTLIHSHMLCAPLRVPAE
jgi:hypothetical protein